MEWTILKNRITLLIGKYKYVLLVIVLGLALMSLPTKTENQHTELPASKAEDQDLTEKLEEILGKIEGVGRVQVLLTQAAAEETVYQQDEDRSSNGDLRLETVIISDGNRTQQGLIRTVTPPTYLGAIVVCQGADSNVVRLAVAQAVAGVTGIGTDRIVVLKMK